MTPDVPGLTIRMATPEDLDLICGHRGSIVLESGHPSELVERIALAMRAWHSERLVDGRYRGWLAEADGEPLAGIGLVLLDWCPGPSHPDTDRRGLVLNLYVEPQHRRRGLAKALLKRVEDEARILGVTFLVLHASKTGRPVYESMNWRATTEMSLTLQS